MGVHPLPSVANLIINIRIKCNDEQPLYHYGNEWRSRHTESTIKVTIKWYIKEDSKDSKGSNKTVECFGYCFTIDDIDKIALRTV